ncbi:trk system potassium uptake protein TrkH [Halanaerobium saccharolyticum]|uniref:Trk system potassium uptake protein TrkH n=1 Tax=Halanaerobium saccharolyticum TaxID=43595 RepID=A0A4V3G5W8_9FIRM|nr:TrkH family potassium uptake protein [Halanaerobium saccharolyticum]RAK11197.1 trk system potassium uptake protein TrkH [Halanaerobium saccharolyticum]TDW07048.1 trk system potassium uptake protein TrkH [Halanaerobium saccharolyticum]TDX63813.1 trk system potassium uptake protein TrkH [Halanaerobium saccharolyticum]
MNLKKKNLTPAQYLVSGYFVIIMIGSLLLMLPVATTDGQGLGAVDAVFTATSATCVTGLIVVNTKEAFTIFGSTVIMFLIQIGGLGIMSMSTLFAFVVGKKISLKERLIIQEDLNQYQISGMVRLVQYLLGFTFAIEGTAAAILFLRLSQDYPFWRAIYLSIFHAVSAFNNAGFDLFGNSLESFTGDITINFVIMALIILGGIGFGVMMEAYNRIKFKKTTLQTKIVIVMTLALLVFGFITFFILEYNNTLEGLPLLDKTLGAMFLSVTPRTAGFNTVPTGALKQSSLFLIIVLMFIGASPGSTGGGIKTTTFGVILVTMKNMITGKEDMEIYNRRFEKQIIYKAFTITMLAAGLVILVTTLLLIIEDFPFIDALFETVSAFGTVGLSTGITGQLSKISRVLITITMFAGRVGPLTLAVAIGEKQRKGTYHYPTEKVMVG